MFSKNEWNPKIREFFLSDSCLARKELYENIEKNAKDFNGNILDLGCGTKPYQHLFNCDSYVGLEINGGGLMMLTTFMMEIFFLLKMRTLIIW